MSCGVGRRHGSDLAWLGLGLGLWLAATAPIGPLAWEPPYASGVALKDKKIKKKKRTCTYIKLYSVSKKITHILFQTFQVIFEAAKTTLVRSLKLRLNQADVLKRRWTQGDGPGKDTATRLGDQRLQTS